METVYLIVNEIVPRIKQKLRVSEVKDEGVISIQSVNYINNSLTEIKVSKDAAEDLRTALDEILDGTPQPQEVPDKEYPVDPICKICKYKSGLGLEGQYCAVCGGPKHYWQWRCEFQPGDLVYIDKSLQIYQGIKGRIINVDSTNRIAKVKFNNGTLLAMNLTSLIKAEGD